MFVVSRRVIDIKEVRELTPDIDMSRSASESKVEEVSTPHVYGLHRFCAQGVSACCVLYQIHTMNTYYVCTLLDYGVQI